MEIDPDGRRPADGLAAGATSSTRPPLCRCSSKPRRIAGNRCWSVVEPMVPVGRWAIGLDFQAAGARHEEARLVEPRGTARVGCFEACTKACRCMHAISSGQSRRRHVARGQGHRAALLLQNPRKSRPAAGRRHHERCDGDHRPRRVADAGRCAPCGNWHCGRCSKWRCGRHNACCCCSCCSCCSCCCSCCSCFHCASANARSSGDLGTAC